MQKAKEKDLTFRDHSLAQFPVKNKGVNERV
jgi:hypothetical protein